MFNDFQLDSRHYACRHILNTQSDAPQTNARQKKKECIILQCHEACGYKRSIHLQSWCVFIQRSQAELTSTTCNFTDLNKENFTQGHQCECLWDSAIKCRMTTVFLAQCPNIFESNYLWVFHLLLKHLLLLCKQVKSAQQTVAVKLYF